MAQQNQISEGTENIKTIFPVLQALGISASVIFFAVAGTEVIFRDKIPGGPALVLLFITSIVFGGFVLVLSAIFWKVANLTSNIKKRKDTVEKREYSLAAIASLISLFTCLVVPLAPIFGVIGLRNIKRSGGKLRGTAAALSGISLGSIVLIILILMKFSGYKTVRTNTDAAIGTMRSIYTAEQTFKTEDHLDLDSDGVGEYGSISELQAKGYIPSVPVNELGLEKGYHFTLTPSHADPENSFFASARPLLNWNTPGDRAPILFTGDRCFYIDESGILYQNTTQRAIEYMTASKLTTEGWTKVAK